MLKLPGVSSLGQVVQHSTTRNHLDMKRFGPIGSSTSPISDVAFSCGVCPALCTVEAEIQWCARHAQRKRMHGHLKELGKDNTLTYFPHLGAFVQFYPKAGRAHS